MSRAKPVNKSFTQTIGSGGHQITFTEKDIEDIDAMSKEFGINDKTWDYGSPGTPESHVAGAKSFNFTAGSDNGCDESSQLDNNWSVQRHFCNLIWHAKECYVGLGRICATTCDVKAGHNARLDIKVISARADPTSVSACTCLSCASNTFDRYSITLQPTWKITLYSVAGMSFKSVERTGVQLLNQLAKTLGSLL